MTDIERALKILGLSADATETEIKQTYRDLAKVWHPDRFPNDPRLQSKAQEKLKEINEAYDILRDYLPQSVARARAGAASSDSHGTSTAGNSEAKSDDIIIYIGVVFAALMIAAYLLRSSL